MMKWACSPAYSFVRIVAYAAKHEARFMKLLTEQTEDGSKRRNAARKKELEAAEKRIAELSAIFKRLYEDSVAGRISDERFMELSADYEAEQKVTNTVNQLKIGKMVFNWLTVFRV